MHTGHRAYRHGGSHELKLPKTFIPIEYTQEPPSHPRKYIYTQQFDAEIYTELKS